MSQPQGIYPAPKGWRFYTADQIKAKEPHACVAGPFGSKISAKYFSEEGVPVIRGSNLRDDLTRFVARDFVFVSSERAREYMPQQVTAGDLVFTCWGTIGQVGIVPADGPFPEYIISNKQLKLRVDRKVANPLFCFYYFASPAGAQYIRNRGIGGAVPGINLGILKALPIALPDLDTQDRIADVLSGYDDLIENNRRRMALLEESARLLYREWFVHLRFPGHEHTPILNGIPLGWQRQKIGEVLDFHIGGGWGQDDPIGSETEEAYVIRGTDIPDVESGDFDNVGLRFHDPRKLSSRLLASGDIVFEVSGGSASQAIGRTLLVTDELLKIFVPRVICASFCKLFRVADPLLPYFLVRFLRHIRESGELSVFQKQSASALQNFQFQAFLEGQDILIPTSRLLHEFYEMESVVQGQRTNLATQNRNLKAARDLLLPRLMSGEITV